MAAGVLKDHMFPNLKTETAVSKYSCRHTLSNNVTGGNLLSVLAGSVISLLLLHDFLNGFVLRGR